jgi:hypothetical protein
VDGSRGPRRSGEGLLRFQDAYGLCGVPVLRAAWVAAVLTPLTTRTTLATLVARTVLVVPTAL